jgi:hypothetical protein
MNCPIAHLCGSNCTGNRMSAHSAHRSGSNLNLYSTLMFASWRFGLVLGSIPYYGERYRKGETVRTDFVESTVRQVVSKRFYLLPEIQHRGRYPDPQPNLGAEEFPARFKIHWPGGDLPPLKVRAAQGL